MRGDFSEMISKNSKAVPNRPFTNDKSPDRSTIYSQDAINRIPQNLPQPF